MKESIFFFLNAIFFLALLVPLQAQNDKYTNPILSGFYPDPSICRVGSDYYLVNSTFAYYPGIPVFHSKDLVHWKLISHVLTNPDVMKLEGLGVSEGIYAPTIRYKDGLFYVACTLVGSNGNFISTTKSPQGPWSDPIWLPEINGIDPSIFFDDDGKSYIAYGGIAPDNNPLYLGHRTIRMREIDISTFKLGKEQTLINGGVDITKNPAWIEGPHIYKNDGYYYLMAAEGGTEENHSEVVLRSKEVFGPYVPYEKNPILTQRHLDPKREDPITCTGHADMVQTETGDWQAVFLGCRPYAPFDENHFNTGRETFLTPVKWIDGWPVINPDSKEVQFSYSLPLPADKEFNGRPNSGNFTARDEFDEEVLSPDWIFLRTPHEKWHELNSTEGYVMLKLRPETCAEKVNPSFIGHRQTHLYGSASAAMEFAPKAGNEKAGLLVFRDETHYYFICQSIERGMPAVQLYKSNGMEMNLLISKKIKENKKLYLKVEAKGNAYSFFYGDEENNWKLLKENVDARFLSTLTSGGFVGCVYALYCTSLGKPTDNTVKYDWFECFND